MTKRQIWVGLDTGADTSRLCAIDQDMQTVLEATVASDVRKVRAALKPLPRRQLQQIAVEAGSSSTHLTRGLRAAGLLDDARAFLHEQVKGRQDFRRRGALVIIPLCHFHRDGTIQGSQARHGNRTTVDRSETAPVGWQPGRARFRRFPFWTSRSDDLDYEMKSANLP